MTISLLATDTNPEQKLQNTLAVYKLLKNEFFSSAYLSLAAMTIVEMVHPDQYEDIAQRTRRIYTLMKKEHPILTSNEDSSFAALLALSKKSNEQIVSETEECYKILKSSFISKNSVQSLSHVLAQGYSSAKLKCHRTMELFEALRVAGCKYGTGYELSTLGVLALLDADIETLVQDITEVNDYLSKQKGFGALGIGSKQRLMYAGMLVANEYIEDKDILTMNTATINGTISLIIAQQAAMCVAISSAVATNSSST